MADAGRRYEFPDGSVYEVEVPGSATGGTRTELKVTLAPRVVASPRHFHPSQEQFYGVTAGELEVLINGDWRRLREAESTRVPAGQVHSVRNPTDGLVEFRLVHAPSGGFERYLERLYWLSAMNRIRRGRHLSSLLYDSLLTDEHRDDLVIAGRVGRIRVRLFAAFARLLRFRVDR